MNYSWKNRFYPALITFLLLVSPPLGADIYKWTDTEGNVHFSDKKSATSNAKPVQMKSSINSYNSSSIPKFEYTPRTNKKVVTRNNKLPKLGPRQVIMYSTVWCGFCKKAKAYFKQKSIAFSERDIEKSTQAKKEYQQLGGGGIPLILVGNKTGTKKISGFSIARFDQAYRK